MRKFSSLIQSLFLNSVLLFNRSIKIKIKNNDAVRAAIKGKQEVKSQSFLRFPANERKTKQAAKNNTNFPLECKSSSSSSRKKYENFLIAVDLDLHRPKMCIQVNVYLDCWRKKTEREMKNRLLARKCYVMSEAKN